MLLKSTTQSDSVSIEMMPLIDMVFLLLIFFLVATTFRQTEREMQIALPFADSAGPISTTLREIIINVDKDGRIVMSGQPIQPDELRSRIEQAVAANPQQKVTVRGDREAAYGRVVAVLDICKGGGIQEPYLDTVLE